MKSIAAIVALTLVAAGSAQLDGIPQACITSLTGVITGPASQCLNLGGLVPLATAAANTSLITPIDSWLGVLCKADPCSNSTLGSLVTNITTGCSSVLTGFGISQSVVATLPALVEQYYTIGRQVICLRDTNANNALCVTSTLRTLETALGAPLTLTSAAKAFPALEANATLAKTVECSQCIQGGWAILRKSLPTEIVTAGDGLFKGQCGDAFITDGQPSNIQTSASGLTTTSSSASSTATSKTPNSALAISPISFSAISLPAGMALSGVFAFVWTLL